MNNQTVRRHGDEAGRPLGDIAQVPCAGVDMLHILVTCRARNDAISREDKAAVRADKGRLGGGRRINIIGMCIDDRRYVQERAHLREIVLALGIGEGISELNENLFHANAA